MLRPYRCGLLKWNVDLELQRVTMVPSHVDGKDEQEPEYTVYNMLAKEFLSEDFVQGKRLLESVISWISAAQHTPPETFPTLEDYMAYRASDVGAGYVRPLIYDE